MSFRAQWYAGNPGGGGGGGAGVGTQELLSSRAESILCFLGPQGSFQRFSLGPPCRQEAFCLPADAQGIYLPPAGVAAQRISPADAPGPCSVLVLVAPASRGVSGSHVSAVATPGVTPWEDGGQGGVSEGLL